MLRHALWVTLLLAICGCTPKISPGGFEATVDPSIVPERASIPDAQGGLHAVAASRDDQGVQSDFLEGIAVVRPRSPGDLQAFLDRYGGTIVGDDSIPEPPSQLGINLTEEQRAPTVYVVRFDPAAIDLSSVQSDARATDLEGRLDFSSEAGQRTFAVILNARAAGFIAGADYVERAQQAFPQTLFDSRERQIPPPPAPAVSFTDAFQEPRYGPAGSQTNVRLAWQFVAAHGIQRRVTVAVIDDGFWIDANGRALGGDSDFPAAPAVPAQFDFGADRAVADGPNRIGCGGGNPCFWHGTGAAGVAVGIMNNQLGYAGTGFLIGEPMLLKYDGRSSNRRRAIRSAIAWGADVVSMSVGSDCNRDCRKANRDDSPIFDHVNAGGRVVFVAAAGNTNQNVWVDTYFYPCIQASVICVGAVNDNGLTKIGYSNFGGGVDIFAPTNIPVMSAPPGGLGVMNPFGTPGPWTFGGTSASAPFVAGVAAMIKAINPDLSSDDVARILVETGRDGVAPVTRVLDALAAVRRAAESIPMVPDRFEPNSLDTAPKILPPAGGYFEPNLNVSAQDRDYFRFDAPGGSTMTIRIEHPQEIATVSIFNLTSLGGPCEPPVLISDAALGNRGHSFTYRTPGGPLLLGLRGNGINAYNLGISFVGSVLEPDSYERNDEIVLARYIHGLKLGIGTIQVEMDDPRVTIEANLHHAADVDYYIVKGAQVTLGEIVSLNAVPTLKLSGNDSPIKLQVFYMTPLDTQGEQVADEGGESCMAKALAVRLKADVYYLVRVSGSPGRYVLRNGVDGGGEHLPKLMRDRVYEVLHPGEPIEHVLRHPELYVLVDDPGYDAVRSGGPRIHMRLLDAEGELLAEGDADAHGERLSFERTVRRQVYGIEVIPPVGEQWPAVLSFGWEASGSTRAGDNLVANPGVEVGGGSDLVGWDVPAQLALPQQLRYGQREGAPSPDDPGPRDRGRYLVAGGDGRRSGLQQTIAIDPGLRPAIDAGRVKASFSAFLGGYRDEGDFAVATLTFLGREQESLGEIVLPSITQRERADRTGLIQVGADDYVPERTTSVRVGLTFTRVTGDFNDSYADNVELTLSELSP